MSGKRKDNKGRVLRTGESQRQDGRYTYKYTDAAGKSQYIYSWKLEEGDKVPAGKKDEPSLRECIRQINKDLEDGIPKITPHVCRHTYCSNMAKAGMNPKTLQYLMGHSDISVTLNTYTHWDFEDAKSDFQKIQNGKW